MVQYIQQIDRSDAAEPNGGVGQVAQTDVVFSSTGRQGGTFGCLVLRCMRGSMRSYLNEDVGALSKSE